MDNSVYNKDFLGYPQSYWKKSTNALLYKRNVFYHSNTARKAIIMEELIKSWDKILKIFKEEYDIQDISFNTFIKPL